MICITDYSERHPKTAINQLAHSIPPLIIYHYRTCSTHYLRKSRPRRVKTTPNTPNLRSNTLSQSSINCLLSIRQCIIRNWDQTSKFIRKCSAYDIVPTNRVLRSITAFSHAPSLPLTCFLTPNAKSNRLILLKIPFQATFSPLGRSLRRSCLVLTIS